MIVEKGIRSPGNRKEKKKEKDRYREREKGKERERERKREHTDRGTDRQAGMWPLNRSHPANQHPCTVDVKTGVYTRSTSSTVRKV